MKIFKEKRGIVISFIIGVILASSITVYATNYLASQVTYKNGKTVENALDDLYSKASELETIKSSVNQTDASASDILSGKKAYTKNGLITGTLNYKSGTSEFVNGNCTIDIGFVPSKVCIYYSGDNDWYGSFVLIGFGGDGYYFWHNGSDESSGGVFLSNSDSRTWKFNMADLKFKITGWGSVNADVTYYAIR